MNIPTVSFSKMSMMDSFGRVFFHENKVYRGIYESSTQQCLSLLNSELFKELTQKGLVPLTKVSDFEHPDFPIVLEHERLLEIKQHEWSFEMLLSVAKMVLEVNNICNKYGYELKDAHNYNILFRGTQPVYGDIGSITEITNNRKTNTYTWKAADEYISTFYLPLVLWKQNEHFLVRKLLESNFHRMQTLPSQHVLESKFIEPFKKNLYSNTLFIRNTLIINTRIKLPLITIIAKLANKLLSIIYKRRVSPVKYQKKFISIDNITLVLSKIKKHPIKTTWQNYHTEFYGDNEAIPFRFKRIIELATDYKNDVSSILDLAGNEGYLCKIIQQNFPDTRIILSDYDSNAVDNAYTYFKETQNKLVHPTLLNFMFSSNIEDTASRYKSDLVLALAVTHHLVLTQGFSIDAIFERLSLFSSKYIFTEFMPLGLWAKNQKTIPDIPPWYNEDWFRTKFSQHFKILYIEQLEENRILYIGEVKTIEPKHL